MEYKPQEPYKFREVQTLSIMPYKVKTMALDLERMKNFMRIARFGADVAFQVELDKDGHPIPSFSSQLSWRGSNDEWKYKGIENFLFECKLYMSDILCLFNPKEENDKNAISHYYELINETEKLFGECFIRTKLGLKVSNPVVYFNLMQKIIKLRTSIIHLSNMKDLIYFRPEFESEEQMREVIGNEILSA